jgi:molybdenum cofactor guanylyltransferase
MVAAQSPTPAPGFDAIVLAGGRATRLDGADKPGLTVAGQSMLSSVLTVAADAGAGTVIVVGPARPGLTRPGPDSGRSGPSATGPGSVSGRSGPSATGPGSDSARSGPSATGPGSVSGRSGPSATGPGRVSFVTECPAGAGPVPALRRGLAEACSPVLVLLAADLPFLRAAQLQLLLSEVGGGQAGAVLVDAAGRPQWLVSCWRAAALGPAAAAYQGTALRGLLQPLRPALVSYRPRAGEAPPWFDCDTAADLALARSWASGAAPVRSEADITPEAHG